MPHLSPTGSALSSHSLEVEDHPEYIRKVNVFLEPVLMLCLTTGGQPFNYDLTCLLLINTQFFARSLLFISEEHGPGHHGNIAILTTFLDRNQRTAYSLRTSVPCWRSALWMSSDSYVVANQQEQRGMRL